MKIEEIFENTKNWNPLAKHPFEKKGDVRNREKLATKDTEEDVARKLVLKAGKAGKKLKKDREEMVKKYPRMAAYYAKNVLKGRWVEAEESIRQDADSWSKYKKFVKSLPEDRQKLKSSS